VSSPEGALSAPRRWAVRRRSSRRWSTRFPCPENRRATNARLTDAGWAKVQASAPGHVANVRQHVIDALSDEQIDQLAAIGDAILGWLDPSGAMAATYTRYDETPEPKSRERAAEG
jgi:hypothetical protein